ncbi:MAG TPA: acylphosphatase [Candidatus Binatia bacterium]|jgi:acylphosphatase
MADTVDQGLRLHLRIRGRVQGVWYRGAMQEEARRHGARGWVRNLPDGSVEAVVEGPATAVRAVADWSRTGPPGARVDGVDERAEPPSGEFVGFDVRY